MEAAAPCEATLAARRPALGPRQPQRSRVHTARPRPSSLDAEAAPASTRRTDVYGADTSARLGTRLCGGGWCSGEGRRGLGERRAPCRVHQALGSQHREQTPTQGGLASDAWADAPPTNTRQRHLRPGGHAVRLTQAHTAAQGPPAHPHPETLHKALGLCSPQQQVTKDRGGLRLERRDRDRDRDPEPWGSTP